jgi:PEP-CTERM motif
MPTMWKSLRRFGAIGFSAWLFVTAWSANAAADVLTPQQVLQIDFVLPDAPFPFGSPDTLVFDLAGLSTEAFGSVTVSLFDRDVLLGTYSSTVNGQLTGNFGGIMSNFVSPTSTAASFPPPFPPATVIDFSSFVDRTIQGRIDVSIAAGSFDFGTARLNLGRSNPGGTVNSTIASNPIITSETLTPSATPEPGSLLLIGTGAFGVLAARRRIAKS